MCVFAMPNFWPSRQVHAKCHGSTGSVDMLQHRIGAVTPSQRLQCILILKILSIVNTELCRGASTQVFQNLHQTVGQNNIRSTCMTNMVHRSVSSRNSKW